MQNQIQSISVIGCGQVGTSILLAMAAQGKRIPTHIYDSSPETAELVRAKFEKEGLDSSHLIFHDTLSEAVKTSDLIVLATPISAFETVSKEIATHAKPGAILTDTGSAKKVAIENILKGIQGTNIQYVAAHPGNGSQGAGPNTASVGNIVGKNSTMFLISEEGEKFIPAEGSPEKTVRDFWNDMGVTTAFITTDAHDKFFGQCSHFQHALVIAAMKTAKDNPSILQNFIYGGAALKNSTRVAISAPEAFAQMWLPIFEQNKMPISEAYNRFKGHYEQFTTLVAAENYKGLTSALTSANTYRKSFDDSTRRETEIGDIVRARAVSSSHANRRSLRGEFGPPILATNLLFPLALAYGQTKSAKEIDAEFIARKANPSFIDATDPCCYDVDHVIKLLKITPTRKEAFLDAAQQFERNLSTLMDAIQFGDQKLIKEYINDALSARTEPVAKIRPIGPPIKGDSIDPRFERHR